MKRCSIVALVALSAVLTGCAPTAAREHVAASIESKTPLEQLHRLADEAARQGRHSATDVPPPPGIEPASLMRRSGSDHHALRTLDDVLADLAVQRPVRDGPQLANIELEPEAQSTALRHYVKARDAALADRHIVAITEFNRALEIDPHSTSILRGLARSHAVMGNHRRASQYYEQLLEIDPDDAEAQLETAFAAYARRDFETAAAVLAARRLSQQPFTHDPAGQLLADYTLTMAIRNLGFDRAAIEAAVALGSSPGVSFDSTMYTARVSALYRDQAELWRWVGDAHCRLGQYERALQAYAAAAQFSTFDAASLHPRILYAQLRLGRVHAAQIELLTILQADPTSISDREISLCTYLAKYAQPIDTFAAALRDMCREFPDEPDVTRAAASVLAPEQSLVMLRAFVERRPRDLHVVGQLLRWLIAQDIAAAVQLTAKLIEDHPDLANEYIGKLFFAAPRPAAILTAIPDQPQSPSIEHIYGRVLGLLGSPGEAWYAVVDARERWPTDAALVALQLDLVVLLEEPLLLNDVVRSAERFDVPSVWLARARAHRLLGQVSEAMAAAERAVELAENHDRIEPRALLELAYAHVSFAGVQDDRQQQLRWAEEAAAIASEVLDFDPVEDDAHELLLNLFGPAGPLQDSDRFRAAARRMYEANPESRLYARYASEEQINRGQFDQALEQLLNLYDTDPSDTRALRLAVTAWVRQERLDAAQSWLNDRIDKRPGDPALLEAWVELMLRQNRADEAIAALEQAATNDEVGTNIARRLLESIYRATGAVDKAFSLGERRLLSRPRGIRRETELAVLYGGIGMSSETISRIRWIQQHVNEATYDQLATVIAVLARLDVQDEATDTLTVELVEQTTARFPNSPLQLYGTGLRSLGRLGMLDGRFDELADHASRHARGAGDPSPQSAVVWRDLAQALVDEGLAPAAARALRMRTIANVPTAREAMDLLATLTIVADAASHERQSDATLTTQLLRELDDRNRLPRLLGMAEQPTLDRVKFQASLTFSLLGNKVGAERLLRQVVAANDQHAIAMNNLGYMRIERGHSDDQTIAWIERAAELQPTEASILDTIGWLRYKQGEFDGEDGAKGFIMRSLNVAEEPSAEVLDHLGDVYWRLGEHEAAIEAWREALHILDRPQAQQQAIQNYLLLQTRAWGLLVADPEELYHRDMGVVIDRLQRKLDAADRGEQPPVAATFAEADSQ